MFKNWERSRLVLRASISTVVLLLVAFLMYPNFLPDRSFAEPGVATNPTISITPSNTATMTLSPGTFGSVSQTITSTTTNYTGYVLTMTTGGDSTNLVNTEDSTLLLPTITLPSDQTSITSANFVANTYGYSLNGTDYKPAPALNEADVIITTNAANTNADTSTLTFGAIVDLTATPGTYQNTFLLSATANDVGYMVSYVANANGDTVTGMPSPNPEPEPTSGLSVNLSDAEPERDGYRFVGWAEDSEANEPDYAPGDELALDPETANITTLYAVWKKLYTIIYVGNDADGGSMNMVFHEDIVEGDTVNLYASNFDRTDYGFLGWSFDKDAAETIGTYNASRIYGPNEEITAPDYVDNEYSTNDNLVMPLFAIWLESSGDIQDWAGCNSMSTGDVIALTDTRDNNTYAIAKLADGRCWMMENMRLSLDSATLTKDNTNRPTDYFLTKYNGAASTTWRNWGSSYWQYKYSNNNINRSLAASPTNNDDTSSWYSYGVYYSWMMAMAGNTEEGSGDLCPNGWRLPTTTEMNSFLSNWIEGNSFIERKNSILSYPKNFILSGAFTADHNVESTWPWDFYIVGRGVTTQYAVSNTKGTDDYTDYSFEINESYLGVYSGYAYQGKAIKCFAQEPVAGTIIYNANGGDNTPSPTLSLPSTGIFTFTISSNTPTRSGYTFSGWMTEDGDEVFPNSSFTSYNPTTTLYAIWTNNSCNSNATTIGTSNNTDAICLQDMNTTVKSSMVLKDIYTLIDARDNKEYTVSLLDDNNVWMTKNLAIGDGTDKLLASFDTDLNNNPAIFLLPASDYIASNTFGNYYDWNTAIADYNTSYYYSSVNTTSLCPLGWDLPTDTQYSKLQSTAGFNSNKLPSSSPYFFNTTGGFYSGTYLYNENYSYLWTAKAASSSTAAYGVNNLGTSLSLSTTTGTSSSAGANRTYRRNVRCIADNGSVTIHYDGNGSVNYPVDTPSSIDRTVSYNEGVVSGNSFTRNHYTFSNWNTAANGSGTTVSSGATVISLNGNYNLYAQWTPNLVVVYHSNDANQTTNEVDVKVSNTWKTLKSDAFTSIVDNMKIGSWNTEPDGSGTTYNTDVQNTAPSSLTEPEILDLYAQWVPTYSFIYNGNGADWGSMASVQQDNIAIGDKVGLISPNFSKTGYGFAGWSLNPNATINSNYTIYGPNEQIEITNDIISNNNNGIITFYAVWVESSGTFQTFDANDYANSPNGTVLALRDERDDNIYAIAKLADGNWWMIENLRLQLASYGQTTDNKTIVGAKSITDGTVNRLTIFNTDNPSSAFLNNNNFENDWKLIGNLGGWTVQFSEGETLQINFGIGNINKENEAAYSDVDDVRWGPHQDKLWYSYGVMYNWYTSTAGTGKWSGVVGTDTEGSICPLGWRLPNGYTNGDTANLKSLVTSINSYPTNAVNAGLYETGPSSYANNSQSDYYRASNYRGTSSYYWTSTYGSSGTAGTSVAYTWTGSLYKVYGIAVRCLAKTTTNYTISYNANGGEGAPEEQSFTSSTGYIEHISNTSPTREGYTFSGWVDENGRQISPNDPYVASKTSTTLYALWVNNFCNPNATTINTGNSATDAVCLQDMNSVVKNSMEQKETYSLVDSRDNKTYTISLLDDGSVWMTKNLELGNENGTLISYHDSDLEEGTYFVLPSSNITFTTGSGTYTTPQFYLDNTYGGYYSWASAIGSTTNYSSYSNQPKTSICPLGWDLPTYIQYDNLRSMAGITTAALASASPYNFVTGGYINNSGLTATTATRLWTSSLPTSSYDASNYAYYSSVYAAASYSSNVKSFGETVRCIASNGKITINYDGNGNESYPVTGTTANQINIEINTATVMSNSFRRTGYSFNGWNTAPDGSGTTVTGSISNYGFSDGDIITLYAQWLPIYTIRYYSNDTNLLTSTSTVVAGNRWYTSSSTAFTSIPGNTKIGFWNTAPDGSGTIYDTSTYYDTPVDMTTPDSIDLYAQWTRLYTIKYDGNGADEGDMASLSHTNVGIRDRIDLFAPNYNKNGYGFAGWSLDPNASANSNDIIYGPNERVYITDEIIAYNTNDIITFYAIWVANSGNMQNFDCSSLGDNEVTALTDSRDNNIYTVTKYTNNETGYSHCWMSENLRLSNTYTENGETKNVVLDSNNTHGFSGVFTSLADPETANFSYTTTSNSLYNTTNITGNSQGQRIPRYNNINTISRDPNPQMQDNKLYGGDSSALSKSIYSYGNNYNWPAAIASTDYYGYTNTTVTTSSICPKGWHLPTGINGEFEELLASVDVTGGLSSTLSYPLNYIRSGYITSSSWQSKGSSGYYWSASLSGSYAYILYVYSNTPGRLYNSSTYTYYGYSVRCIADTPAPEPDPESTAPEEATTESSTDDTIVVDLGDEVEKAENPENKEETENNEDFSKETDELSDEISS